MHYGGEVEGETGWELCRRIGREVAGLVGLLNSAPVQEWDPENVPAGARVVLINSVGFNGKQVSVALVLDNYPGDTGRLFEPPGGGPPNGE